MRVGTVIVSLGIALLPHLSQAQTDCGRPIAGNDGWPVAAPETVGLAPATLCPTVKWLKNSKEKNVHAVLVARHGKLVFEAYSSGNDEHWGQAVGDVAFGPETKHDVRSATKSVVGLAFGIAIDRGLIKSVDEPVLSFFPEYADLRTPEKDKITLRHLLTMSAGLEWHETGLAALDPANSQLRMDDAADPYRFVLEQKVVSPPLPTCYGIGMRRAVPSLRAACGCGHAILPRSVNSCCNAAHGAATSSCRPRGSRPRRRRRSTIHPRLPTVTISGSTARPSASKRSTGPSPSAGVGSVCTLRQSSIS